MTTERERFDAAVAHINAQANEALDEAYEAATAQLELYRARYFDMYREATDRANARNRYWFVSGGFYIACGLWLLWSYWTLPVCK